MVAAAVASAGMPAAGAAGDDAPRIDVAGTLRLPATAVVADGSTVAIDGVSGLTWLGGDDGWVAVMDTGTALVSFALDLGADGRPGAVRDVRAMRLAERHDYEDVAPCPPAWARRLGAAAGRPLILCEEDTPALRVVDAAGAIVGGLALPDVLATRRPNRGLEALCAAADGEAVWTANEEALVDDGPPPARGSGTVVRIARVPLAAGDRHGRQIAYAVDPPHDCATVAAGPAYSGLVALAALPDGRLLVLERSASRCLPPFENRIYVVDPAAALDVAEIANDLAERPDTHAVKRLAWRGGLGCNLEGLAIGPPLAAGGTALVAVADAGGLAAPSRLVVLRLDPPLTSP